MTTWYYSAVTNRTITEIILYHQHSTNQRVRLSVDHFYSTCPAPTASVWVYYSNIILYLYWL